MVSKWRTTVLLALLPLSIDTTSCENVLSLFFQSDCLQLHLKEAISRDLKLKLHMMKEVTTEQSSRPNRISHTRRRVK